MNKQSFAEYVLANPAKRKIAVYVPDRNITGFVFNPHKDVANFKSEITVYENEDKTGEFSCLIESLQIVQEDADSVSVASGETQSFRDGGEVASEIDYVGRVYVPTEETIDLYPNLKDETLIIDEVSFRNREPVFLLITSTGDFPYKKKFDLNEGMVAGIHSSYKK